MGRSRRPPGTPPPHVRVRPPLDDTDLTPATASAPSRPTRSATDPQPRKPLPPSPRRRSPPCQPPRGLASSLTRFRRAGFHRSPGSPLRPAHQTSTAQPFRRLEVHCPSRSTASGSPAVHAVPLPQGPIVQARSTASRASSGPSRRGIEDLLWPKLIRGFGGLQWSSRSGVLALRSPSAAPAVPASAGLHLTARHHLTDPVPLRPEYPPSTTRFCRTPPLPSIPGAHPSRACGGPPNSRLPSGYDNSWGSSP